MNSASKLIGTGLGLAAGGRAFFLRLCRWRFWNHFTENGAERNTTSLMRTWLFTSPSFDVVLLREQSTFIAGARYCGDSFCYGG